MAATVTPVSRCAIGDQMQVTTDVKGDGSYPAGGYPISLAQLGFVSAEGLTVDTQKNASGSDGAYDFAAGKLKFFSGGATEATGDQSGTTVRVQATGKYAT